MSSIQVRLITVSLDGSGDYDKVQEAIDSVSLSNGTRTVIQVSPGLYKGPLYVPKTKNLITLTAYSPEKTIISWQNTATCINHHQASRVIGTGTFGCGSVIIEGEDFIAENITFENSAPQGSGQAVAVRVTADRCAFYNCRFLGWQVCYYWQWWCVICIPWAAMGSIWKGCFCLYLDGCVHKTCWVAQLG